MSYSLRPLYYDGQPQSSLTSSQSTFTSINPANGRALGNIQSASHADIDAAINSARKAFQTWSQTPPIERSRILLRAVALLRARNDELAKIETHDTGKPFSETSTVDIVTGADVLEYYANLVASGGLNGETTQLRNSAWVYTTKNPLGVCAGIGAWNYPIQIALWKSAPCLAAGNCMVYKPSEFTSLHGLELANIYTEAGVPAGVFNVVNGAGDVGAYLTQHPGIAKVSFTGQVSTGQKVAASAAGGMKYVTMELGGKSPLVILPDCELEAAVDGAMMANFFSTGQVCTNGTRVFVPESMLQAFEKRLVEKCPTVHYDKVLSYIHHAINVDKAKLLHGGLEKPSALPKDGQDGFWVQPTVFTNCTDEMRIAREEIFGPVMSILPYSTVESAIQRANATPMGLAAGVFTSDLNRAHGVIAQLQAGITWINTWGESPAEMPVGGWKLSGVGVENGRKGLDAWVRNKSTLVEMGGSVPTVFAKL
ncbi:hypothetical protein H2203_000013 [Taxawa tesnikishii (nom. ined.)]|nr:hypothetical protein H2203_000013 [Dothideales sp. JES 119]